MKNNRRWTFPLNPAIWMSVSLAGMAVLAGCATRQPEVKPTTTGWVKNQVADAYTFGFPLVASDIARERASGRDADVERDRPSVGRLITDLVPHFNPRPITLQCPASPIPQASMEPVSMNRWCQDSASPSNDGDCWP